MGVGGTGQDARGTSSKTSCGCFYPSELVQIHMHKHSLQTIPYFGSVVQQIHAQINPGMPVCRS